MDTPANLENSPGPSPAGQEALPPVWLQRAQVFVYVLFCLVLGMYLVLLPWYRWFENGLVEQWPALQRALHHGFVRGAVSGLGLVDIWMGISEAVNYHDRH